MGVHWTLGWLYQAEHLKARPEPLHEHRTRGGVLQPRGGHQNLLRSLVQMPTRPGALGTLGREGQRDMNLKRNCGRHCSFAV